MAKRVSLAVFLLSLLAAAPAAEARLTVCNRSADPVRLALGQEQGQDWVSQGWWTLQPGACATPLPGELTLLEYYLRAEPLVKGKTGWGGEFPFCVADGKDFQAKGDQDCEKRGLRTAGFFAVVTDGATSVTHNLTE
ncbi:DUF1036 domain-containing protein [Aerophototrophica crusticola]|uniref:DUF1036 domain-containing protein n=1 Tax=Aerophototrophica crusticola TaxID=1709002 RepID=A0A858R5C0_9PROT|nr:DUF1036 domain-containing protein [Rhodospirillaceae bacterium B3]